MYFSVDQVEQALTKLQATTHSTLASLLAMWANDLNVQPAPFKPYGSAKENDLLRKYFSPVGAPAGAPYFFPFYGEQGKTRWRTGKYAGSSLQRQRRGLKSVLVQKPGNNLEWAFTKDYVAELMSLGDAAIGETPIPLPTLAAWMLRGDDHYDMKDAVTKLIAELHLDRDGIVDGDTLFTKDDVDGIGDPAAPDPIEDADLLEMLTRLSPPPATSTNLGTAPGPAVVVPDLDDGAWHIDPSTIDLGGLEGLEEVAFAAASALSAGAHILFLGAPGTGKTTLGAKLCEAAGVPHMVSTATDSWTTFESIGGYFPTPTIDSGTSDRLDFLPGIVVDAIAAGRCLVIDELNRADMDKAFGELFTLFTGQSVTLPFRTRVGDTFKRIRLMTQPGIVEDDIHGIAVPASWRMIGAMNDADRGGVKRMSTALRRRFSCFVVPMPPADTYRAIIERAVDPQRSTVGGNADRLVDSLVGLFATDTTGFASIGQPLGPAFPLDMIEKAVAQWRWAPQRDFELVLDSVLESEIAPAIGNGSADIATIVDAVRPHVGNTPRFADALRRWGGR